jgi:hypothetical protein
MEQLSRPYQIALVALVLAALTWFLALGHHSSSSSTSGSSSSSQSSPTASTPTKPAAPASSGKPSSHAAAGGGSSPIYHGAAPGVEGLTRDIAKAHQAAATSQGVNNKIEESSQRAAREAGEAPSSTASQSGGAPGTHAPSQAAKSPAGSATASAPAGSHSPSSRAASPATTAPKHPAGTSQAPGTPSGQKAVEADVAGGKIALLLFWNPAGSTDVAVRGQVQAVGRNHLPVVVYEGGAGTVASFGAITRQIPVYGTPTILIVGAKGHASTLTGLQDTYTIEHALHEVG